MSLKWFVTFKQVDREQVLEQINLLGCEIIIYKYAVFLNAGEEVIFVEGPDDLDKLVEPFKDLLKVHPNSKKEK